MGFKAIVYLERSGTTQGLPLGEMELEIRPVRYGRAKFEHNGKIEIGRIVQVSPADWDHRGVIPTVYVSQNSGLFKCEGCGETAPFTTLESGRRPRSRRDWEAAVRKLAQHGVSATVK